jgi:integrase
MPKKQTNNGGTVYKDNSQGGYRAQLTLEDGRRMSKRFAGSDDERSEQEAHDWLTEQLYKISKSQFINPSELTLSDWLLEWLNIYSKQNVRQRTFERYKSLAKRCEPLAGFCLQDLRPNHFQKLYVSLGQYSQRNAQEDPQPTPPIARTGRS